MNSTNKTMIINYLLGYRHTVNAKKTLTNGFTSKDEQVVDYLHLYKLSKKTQKIIIAILKSLEIPISLIIVLIELLFVSFLRVFYRHKTLNDQILHIGKNILNIRYLYKKARINESELIIITNPLTKNRYLYDGLLQVSVLSNISFSNIYHAAINAIKTIFIIIDKYGKEDYLFRSYSSFEYYLFYYYFLNIDNSNTILYTSTYDRWALLAGCVGKRTIFIQHGIIPDNLKLGKTIGTPHISYYLNRQQETICNSVLFNGVPQKTYYLDGISLNAESKLINNANINVLLICNHLYMDKQHEIVTLLESMQGFNIYIKPHPLDDRDNYAQFLNKDSIVLLEDSDFPKVDVAISYHSTLAYEYEAVGIHVIRHDLANNTILIKELNNIKSSLDKRFH